MMHLNAVLQLLKTDYSLTPLSQKFKILPQEANVRSLLTFIESLKAARENGVISECSLTVIMHPGQLSGLELMTEDDQSKAIQQVLGECPFETRFINRVLRQIEGPILWAKRTTRELLYYGETNALFSRESLVELLNAHFDLNSLVEGDFLMTPFDHADYYKGPYPSKVITGRTRYLRTVPFCTRQLLMTKTVFQRFEEALENDRRLCDKTAAKANETLIPILRLIPCFAPMPSLGELLSSREEAPFADRWNSGVGATNARA